MLNNRLLLTVLGVLALPCEAQFGPSLYSVSNSASYSAQGAVAQGSIFVVFGNNLGGPLQTSTGYPLQTQINGTSVTASVGGVSTPCLMVYSSFGQVAAILPSRTPLGSGSISVRYQNRSGSIAVQVVKSDPGIFTVGSSGAGPAIVTALDYTVKSFGQPAKVDEIVTLWTTGLGPVVGDEGAGPLPGQTFQNIEVFVGNQSAKIVYAGRSGCCAGLDQIAVQIPDGTKGCFVPVVVRSGTAISNFASVSISGSGAQCAINTPGIPDAILSRALAGEQLKVAAIGLGPIRILQGAGFSFAQGVADRLSIILHRKVDELDVLRVIRAYSSGKVSELKRILAKYGLLANHLDPSVKSALRVAIGIDQEGAAAAFGSFRGLPAFSPTLVSKSPPIGTCTVNRDLPANSGARSSSLDAGPSLSLQSPLGSRVLNRISNGQYQVSLGSGFPTAKIPTGLYTISGAGGKQIGAFTGSLNVTSTLAWSNKAAINSVVRSQPLTITWSGGSVPGHVLIGGSSHILGTSTTFICVEDSSKGMFTVPAFVLSALYGTDSSNGYLFIGPHPLDTTISIPGVDLAFIWDASSDYKAVPFR